MKKESNAPLLLTLSSKRCSCCGEVKPTTEFTKKKHGKWGFESGCKECNNKRSKKYRIDNQEKYKRMNRNRMLKYRYGLTLEDLEKMLRDQDNKCVICGREIFLHGTSVDKNKIAHVDHDHKTDKVRGLLCKTCNTGLGGFMDNTEYLLSVISYLNKNTWQSYLRN